MSRFLALLLLLLWQQFAYSAENFAGFWKYEESCSAVEKRFSQEDSAGVKVKCTNEVNVLSVLEDAEGNPVQAVPPDFFSIDLVNNEDLLCGIVISTAMNSNRVDSSIVVGWVSGSRADLVFSSSFSQWTETGTATLILDGANAKWRVTKEIPNSYTWPKALVEHQASSERSKTRDACKDKWELIRKRDISGISFEFL